MTLARVAAWALLAMLVLDSVGLAMIGLFYLPLRLPPSVGGGAAAPVAVLLSAVVLPLVVSAAARYGPGVPAAGIPLGAWLLTIMVFGVAGPGGDRVLVGDWRALLLMAAGLVPGAVALGRAMARTITAATAPPPQSPREGSV